MVFSTAKGVLFIEVSSSEGDHCTHWTTVPVGTLSVGLQLGVRVLELVDGVDATGHVGGVVSC